MCHMSFKLKSHQKQHMATHLTKVNDSLRTKARACAVASPRSHAPSPSIKDFQCSYEGCGKRYSGPTNLKIHLRTHTGERPYSCPHCDSAFTAKGNLMKHFKRIHLSPKLASTPLMAHQKLQLEPYRTPKLISKSSLWPSCEASFSRSVNRARNPVITLALSEERIFSTMSSSIPCDSLLRPEGPLDMDTFLKSDTEIQHDLVSLSQHTTTSETEQIIL